MVYIYGRASNIGVSRQENQDRAAVVTTPDGKSCLAVLCDGMGGLSHGEVASQLIAETLEGWFVRRLSDADSPEGASIGELTREILSMLCLTNRDLIGYGEQIGESLGSTASVLLIMDGEYSVVHIGDSRVYMCSDTFLQLTDDDSAAADKVRRGIMTPEEARCSRDQHLLTQCIGVHPEIHPHVYSGKCGPGDVFFLCSDGMYHKLSDQELHNMMMSQRMDTANRIPFILENLIDKVISRGEKDNITGVLVKVSE